MERSFQFPSACDGRPVHVMEWSPAALPPRALVQIAHGVAEHISRYAGIARFLNGQGFLVFGNDHLGHGQTAPSADARGHACDRDGWRHWVDDMVTLMRLERATYPGVPVFLLGHSMGSFLARTLLIRYADEPLAGCVLTGTTHMPIPAAASGWLLFSLIRVFRGPRARPVRLDRALFGSYNRLFRPNRTKNDWLSSDPAVVDAYTSDPLCGFTISAASYQSLMSGLVTIARKSRIRKMNPALPLLIASGALDAVGRCGAGPRRVARMLSCRGARAVAVVIYDGARHEILNETIRDRVYADITHWFDDQLTT